MVTPHRYVPRPNIQSSSIFWHPENTVILRPRRGMHVKYFRVEPYLGEPDRPEMHRIGIGKSEYHVEVERSGEGVRVLVKPAGFEIDRQKGRLPQAMVDTVNKLARKSGFLRDRNRRVYHGLIEGGAEIFYVPKRS